MCESVYDDDHEREERVSTWTGDNTGLHAQETVLKRQRVCRILLVARRFLPHSFPCAHFRLYDVTDHGFALVESTGIFEPLPAEEPRLGRRMALTFPLRPPPQKN